MQELQKVYGDNYLSVLSRIDKIVPSKLTNFSQINNDNLLDDNDAVKKYLLLKSGKNYGLAILRQQGLNIPNTWTLTLNSPLNEKFVSSLPLTSKYKVEGMQMFFNLLHSIRRYDIIWVYLMI